MSGAKKNTSRRIGFSSTTSKDVFVAASKIIDNNVGKIGNLIGRKKLSDLIKLNKAVNDSKNIAHLFSQGIGFDLRFYECLSLAYVCRFSEHKGKSDYVICVDIDDRFKSQTDKELFLSDGVVAHVTDGEVDGFTPMQQVLAQNIIGKNIGKNITEILIEETNKKIKKRESYNDISGLIVTVIGVDQPPDIAKIIESVNVNSFNPTFLVIYGKGGNLKKGLVIHLSSDTSDFDELKKRSLVISIVS